VYSIRRINSYSIWKCYFYFFRWQIRQTKKIFKPFTYLWVYSRNNLLLLCIRRNQDWAKWNVQHTYNFTMWKNIWNWVMSWFFKINMWSSLIISCRSRMWVQRFRNVSRIVVCVDVCSKKQNTTSGQRKMSADSRDLLFIYSPLWPMTLKIVQRAVPII